jgi:hypothetical protein
MGELGLQARSVMGPSRLRRWSVLAASVVLLAVVACWPVETRSGFNYQYSGTRLRLYEKAIDFLSRDFQTRRLVRQVVAGRATDQERALAIFDWVTARVKPTPDGFPVVDDHPLYIIIRGYGQPDQQTEAFSLLASYAGMPSAATLLKDESNHGLVVAAVSVAGRVFLFDVVHRIMFRDRDGSLADVDRLIADPSIVSAAARGLVVDNVPYERFFAPQSALRPTFARMELQKPWTRAADEAGNLISQVVHR